MRYLDKYLHEIALPNPALTNTGKISSLFINKNLHTFYEAIDYIHAIPYAPLQNRSDYCMLLEEECGTCSPKHALLTALANELEIPLELYVGAILMDGKNTPLIKPVLEKYHLNSVLEAHAYTKYHGNVIDITFPKRKIVNIQYAPVEEIHVTPDFIGEEKEKWHQRAIKKWLNENNIPYTLEEFWDIRMQCLGKLFKQT